MTISPTPRELKEQARAIWTESAVPWRKWRREMAHQSRAATDLIVQAAQVRPGMRVLDLASGAGEPALSLAAAVAPDGHVIATDLVPAMLSAIEEDARAGGLTTLSVQQADMEALPFPDHRFDAVTCRFTIMFPPDVDQALREVRRVLTPGGRAAFVVWGPPDQPFFTTSLGIFMKYSQQPPPPPGAPSPFRFARPGSLPAALQAAGFIGVEETAHTILWTWPGPPDEAWAAMGEAQSALFRQFRAALDAGAYARATAEALAALRGHYNGHEVRMSARVISVVALA